VRESNFNPINIRMSSIISHIIGIIALESNKTGSIMTFFYIKHEIELIKPLIPDKIKKMKFTETLICGHYNFANPRKWTITITSLFFIE